MDAKICIKYRDKSGKGGRGIMIGGKRITNLRYANFSLHNATVKLTRIKAKKNRCLRNVSLQKNMAKLYTTDDRRLN